jgi:hypothetical protein
MSGLPEIEAENSPTYKRINVAGIYGGIVPGGLDAVLYSEERRIEKVLETEPLNHNRMYVKRIAEVDLILDPLQMKAVHKWIGDKIAEYEKIFGRIPSPEELEARTRRKPEGT